MERSSRIKDEIKGILAILAGLVVAISLISHNPWDQSFSTQSPELKNLLGRFGSNLSDFLLQAIGFASYLIPLILIITGVRKVLGKSSQQRQTIFIISGKNPLNIWYLMPKPISRSTTAATWQLL